MQILGKIMADISNNTLEYLHSHLWEHFTLGDDVGSYFKVTLNSFSGMTGKYLRTHNTSFYTEAQGTFFFFSVQVFFVTGWGGVGRWYLNPRFWQKAVMHETRSFRLWKYIFIQRLQRKPWVLQMWQQIKITIK